MKQWKPKSFDLYYTPEINTVDLCSSLEWDNDYADKLLFDRGLVFKTKQEAIDCAKRMLEVVKPNISSDDVREGKSKPDKEPVEDTRSLSERGADARQMYEYEKWKGEFAPNLGHDPNNPFPLKPKQEPVKKIEKIVNEAKCVSDWVEELWSKQCEIIDVVNHLQEVISLKHE